MKEFNNFQKSYLENGKKNFLKLLSALLEFDLSENVDNITIAFIPEENAITIKNNKNIDYTLTLYEDHLSFSRKKSNYQLETLYHYNFEPYQNIIYFKGQNNNTIALQETIGKNMQSRRLVYYGVNDTSYPKYEKEIIKLNNKPVECESNYQNSNNQLQTYKVMRMEDCVYYYHFQTYPRDNSQPYTSFLEVAATTNIPKLNIYSRLNEEESLRDAITYPHPNIIISGTVLSNNHNPNLTYKIKITKEGSKIHINVLSINIEKFSEIQQTKTISATNEDEITITEINYIIKMLKDMIPESLLLRVIPELQNIQNNINTRNNQIKIGDFLDCNLNLYPKLKDLALDILKNLYIYEQFIKNSVEKQKKDNQSKLIRSK